MSKVTVQFEVDSDTAHSLAQFLKRVGYQTCQENAGSQKEAEEIWDGLAAVRAGLAHAGYAPR